HELGEAIPGRPGAWGFARGGMGAVTAALRSAAEAAGARIHTEAPVARILIGEAAARAASAAPAASAALPEPAAPPASAARGVAFLPVLSGRRRRGRRGRYRHRAVRGDLPAAARPHRRPAGARPEAARGALRDHRWPHLPRRDAQPAAGGSRALRYRPALHRRL